MALPPIYPSTLPIPSSFVLSPAAHALFGDNEVGPREPRLRTRDPGAVARISFRFLEDDYQAFVNWWRDDLKFGLKWFLLPLPSSSGAIMFTVCRFAERHKAQHDGYTFWTVNATIIIRERRFEPYVIEGDPYWQDVKLLIRSEPGVGFIDSSLYNRPLTIVGGVTFDPAIGPWGLGSLNMNGGYITVPDNANWAFSGNGITFELWYYRLATSDSVMYDFVRGSQSNYLGYGAFHNGVVFSGMGSGVTGTIAATGVWTHIVQQWWDDPGPVSRAAIYQNGYRIWNPAGQPQFTDMDYFVMWYGSNWMGGTPWVGRLAEFRITDRKRYDEYFDGSSWRINVPTERMLGEGFSY